MLRIIEMINFEIINFVTDPLQQVLDRAGYNDLQFTTPASRIDVIQREDGFLLNSSQAVAFSSVCDGLLHAFCQTSIKIFVFLYKFLGVSET